MIGFLTWLSAHATSLAALGTAVAFVWSVWQYVDQRRRESNDRQFEAYHKLVKELVSPDPESKVLWIQRQAAVIFELRHFPRYFEFTERMLMGLREKWSTDPEFHWPMLLEEIDSTLEQIRK